MRVGERKGSLSKPRFDRGNLRPRSHQSRAPKIETARRNRERDFGAQSMTLATRREIGPRKKSDVGPRVPLSIGIEKVISARIILVHTFLHQPHPQYAD